VPLYRLAADLPQMRRDAVLVASFDGWVDAAEAASRAVGHVAGEGRVVATFDPDAVFDYRSRRPVLDVQDGRLTELSWPALEIHHDLRWQELAADAVDLVARLGVSQWISLGAVPGAVAHTRQVPVMVTASREGLLAPSETPGPEGLLRVPSAALSVLEMAVTGAGTPAVGFYAQVPPYASIGYAAASIALIDRLARHLDVPIAVEELLDEERQQHARYDAAVAGDAMLRETVSRLESAAGDMGDEPLPSGDELAREIERYLRRQGEGGESP
jgi:hypothetical protein